MLRKDKWAPRIGVVAWPSGRRPPNADASRLEGRPDEPKRDQLPHNQRVRVQPQPTEAGQPDGLDVTGQSLWLDSVLSGAKVCVDVAIQAILTLKVLFRLALRQA